MILNDLVLMFVKLLGPGCTADRSRRVVVL